EPRDGWNPKRQNGADQTDAPCADVNASRKGPQCEHRQCRKRASIGVHHPADVDDEHETHCHEHRAPMQCLRPDKMQALLPVFCVTPPRDNTNESDERRQNDPVCCNGGLGETRICNTEDRKAQHQEVGPLPDEEDARVESPSVGCRIVLLKVCHVQCPVRFRYLTARHIEASSRMSALTDKRKLLLIPSKCSRPPMIPKASRGEYAEPLLRRRYKCL